MYLHLLKNTERLGDAEHECDSSIFWIARSLVEEASLMTLGNESYKYMLMPLSTIHFFSSICPYHIGSLLCHVLYFAIFIESSYSFFLSISPGAHVFFVFPYVLSLLILSSLPFHLLNMFSLFPAFFLHVCYEFYVEFYFMDILWYYIIVYMISSYSFFVTSSSAAHRLGVDIFIFTCFHIAKNGFFFKIRLGR